MLKRKKSSTAFFENTLDISTKETKAFLDEAEKKNFNNHKDIISKVNECLHLLNQASLLTEEIRKKIIELTSFEKVRHFPFGVTYANLLYLQKENQLNPNNVNALLTHTNFRYTGAKNLIELTKLNISTLENRRIAVCVEDVNTCLPKFLELLMKKNITLNDHICFDLEEILRNNITKVEAIIYNLTQAINESIHSTAKSFQEYLQEIRIKKTIDHLPLRFHSDTNIQLIHKHSKDYSLIDFFNLLNFGKSFTQENFDKIIKYSAHLRRYKTEIQFSSHSTLVQKNFDHIIKKIINDINISALECITLKQGMRSKAGFFHKMPEDLATQISKFLIPFSYKKTVTTFQCNLNEFHKNLIKKRVSP